MYRNHLRSKGEAVIEEAVKKRVPKCLSEKIADINRKMKAQGGSDTSDANM